MKIEVTFTGCLTTDAEDPAVEYDRALDSTMEELLRLPVIDPGMSGTLSTGEVGVRVTVEAENVADAVTSAYSALRAALHAAEVNTAEMDHGAVNVTWHKVEADDLIDA